MKDKGLQFNNSESVKSSILRRCLQEASVNWGTSGKQGKDPLSQISAVILTLCSAHAVDQRLFMTKTALLLAA